MLVPSFCGLQILGGDNIKKLLVIFTMIILLLSSCDLFNTGIPEFIEEYGRRDAGGDADITPPVISKVTIGVNELTSSGGTVGITENTATFDVEITATDIGGSGVSGYQITASSDVSTTADWITTTTSPISISDQIFTHNVSKYIWVKDNAGNVSAGFMVTATNTTAPVITEHRMEVEAVDRLPARAVDRFAREYDRLILTVIASDENGSGIATENAFTATIKINSVPVVENLTQTSNVFTYIVEAGKTGAVSYTVSVKDNAGNVSVAEGNTDVATTITVDTLLPNDAPVVYSYKQKSGANAFKSAGNKYFYKEDGGITFTFTKRADIKGYTTVALNPTPGQITDSITLTASTHKVYAVDIANNVSLAGLTLVVVEDTTPPVITEHRMEVEAVDRLPARRLIGLQENMID